MWNRFNFTTILLLHDSIISSCITNCLFFSISKNKNVCWMTVNVNFSPSRQTVKISEESEWLSRKSERGTWQMTGLKQTVPEKASEQTNEWTNTLIWFYLKLCDSSVADFSWRNRVFTPIEAFHFVVQLSHKVYFQRSRPWKTRSTWLKKTKGT